MGRKLSQPPGAFPGERVAPLNGRISLSLEGGANPLGRRRLFRVKSLRPIMENDVLPVNRTMKKYKIYVTSNLNFLLADF